MWRLRPAEDRVAMSPSLWQDPAAAVRHISKGAIQEEFSDEDSYSEYYY